MAKTLLQEIAASVAKKHKLTNKFAESFISQIFAVVKEGLNEDKQVKVKGLGTFKIVNVKSRESINVQTGQRVVIDSHDRITFTPDSSMKELVNRPFSQFDTVVLEDGVEFSDIPTETIERQEGDDETMELPVEENGNKPIEEEVQQEKDVQEEGSTVQEEDTVVQEEHAKTEENVAIATLVSETHTDKEDEEPANATEDNPRSGLPNWLKIAALVVWSVVCLAIGYCLGHKNNGNTLSDSDVSKAIDTTATTTDSISVPSSEVAKEPVDELDLDKLNADPRVKYGAYTIEGIDTIITLREGQTMESYCRATLGAGMLCYFQALNDTAELSGGTKMKVPKVKVKKRK